MTKIRAGILDRLHIAVLGLTLGGMALLLNGCSLSSTAAPQDTAGAAMTGIVHGGQQPVQNAAIQLFATTSAGYSGTPNLLASTTTSSTGTWNISTTYTCPAGQQAYIVATGGNPGSGSPNSAIMLVAALGPCSGISSSTYVDINEVTTVAAAYAIGGFAPAGGANFGTTTAGFTTKSTNTQGLADAFANANNIVNFQTGAAYTATPTTSANGVVPQSTINTLADILQDCVNSTGPSTTACTNLFSAATPPAGSGVSAPTNTFQAALDIAQYPGNNVSTLYGLVSAAAAFEPTLSAVPNDWTIGVTYTNAALVSGSGLGISSNDTVYVAGTDYLIDFSAQGSPISTTSLLSGPGSSDALRHVVFDKTGNLFVTDGSATGVWELSSSNSSTLLNFDVAPVNEANNNTYGLAVDGLGDVWTTSYSKSTCSSVTCPLIEFVKGTSYSPASTFSSFTVNQPTGSVGGARDVAFDVNTGNIWITAIDDNVGELFTVTPSASGAATATAAATTLTGLGGEVSSDTNNTGYGTISVAVDKNSKAWFVTAGGPAVTTGSHQTSAVGAAITPVSSTGTVGTPVTGGGLNIPTQVVVDGNNNLFVANTGANAVLEYNSTLGSFVSPSGGFIQSSSSGPLYQPSYLEVDRSGAIWTLSSGNGTSHPSNLIQILGVAAPTDPVQADGNYGVKP